MARNMPLKFEKSCCLIRSFRLQSSTDREGSVFNDANIAVTRAPLSIPVLNGGREGNYPRERGAERGIGFGWMFGCKIFFALRVSEMGMPLLDNTVVFRTCLEASRASRSFKSLIEFFVTIRRRPRACECLVRHWPTTAFPSRV